MTKRRKKRKRLRIIRWIRNILLIVFITALISLIWNYVSDRALTVLIVSGIGLLILIILGFLTPSRVKNKIKKEVLG